MSPETTAELLAPEVEDLGPRRHWLARLFGAHQHCFHENPRHNRPDAGVLVRICCHCGRNERNQLVPADHGRHHPERERVALIWSGWVLWYSPEQYQYGGMGY